MESIREWNAKWVAAGAKMANLKEFNNCRSVPTEFLPLNGAIVSLFPHGKVHLKIELVNDFYDDLVKAFPEAKAWPEHLHLRRSEYFGGVWEGRQRSSLLAKVDLLQEIVNENDDPWHLN